MSRTRALAVAAVVSVTAVLAGSTASGQTPDWAPPSSPTPLATGDFDGDGFDDLATGVASEDISGKTDAGAVHVLYGGADGVRTDRSQLWHQGTSGVPGTVQSGDRFGTAVATGDFDGDGFDDLAVGAPYEDVSVRSCSGAFKQNCSTTRFRDAGHVVVLYGSAGGLTRSGSDGWARNTSGVQGRIKYSTLFGWALAAGDFDGDGFDDLGIGAPGEDRAEGVVHVLFGHSKGLRAARDQLWTQGRGGLDEKAEEQDWFGASLAAGNLGYSTREDDLAIGVPGEGFAKTDVGAVHVLYGQPAKGLTTTLVPDRLLHYDVSGVPGEPQNFAGFGSALAIANFGRSEQGDLAVGSPGYLVESGTGAVLVFYGGSYGVVPAESELWHHGTASLGNAEQNLRFGAALAAADFNGFSQADLAIGAPDGEILDASRTGTVSVIFGSPLGLRVTGSIAVKPQFLTRRTFVNPMYRTDDRFGFALAAGNFGKGAAADLAISGPGVDRGDGADKVDTGEVYVGYGGTGGVSRQVPTHWHQDTEDVDDVAEAGDRLGG